MQRGFTENTSSINTGLLLTEYKNESKEKKTPVFAVTLNISLFQLTWVVAFWYY
jgi:hypothetical protein